MSSRAVTSIKSIIQKKEQNGFILRRVLGHSETETNHIDPFVLLDHFGPAKYGPGEALGAPDHPHRGIDVVTYMIQGGLSHLDSAGNSGELGPGYVQWMCSGAGIVHCEMPTEVLMKEGGTVEGFQLWINLQKLMKKLPPIYQDTCASEIPNVYTDDKKGCIKIIAGEALGVSASINTTTQLTLLDITLKDGGTYSHPLRKPDQGFLYCWFGEGTVGSTDAPICIGQIAEISESKDGDTINMKAMEEEECRLLLVLGEPIKEPVVHDGPFVMNTEAEIEKAYDDFEDGYLGRIPHEEDRIAQNEAALEKNREKGLGLSSGLWPSAGL